MNRFNPAQIVLGAVCAVLALLFGYLVFAPIPEISVPQVQARTEQPADDAPLPRFDAPPRQAFAEVDDRLVFNPQRVRVEAPSQPGTGATTLPSDLSLVGVIMDRDTKLALFKSSAAPLAVGVAVGGSIEGWQVTRVDPDRVALRSGGAEQELKFSSTSPTPGPAIGPSRCLPNCPPGMGPNFRPPFMRNNVNNNNNNNNNNENQNANHNNNNNNNNNNSDDSDDDSN